jgi:ubiquinone/menaquinone biosynthesis C-methylase UbiE
MNEDRKSHWDGIYSQKTESQLSWHQDNPSISLELAEIAGIAPTSSVIDVGGGISRFIDCLIEQGLSDLTVLDLSKVAIDVARQRLGKRGGVVNWIASDITKWSPSRDYDLWHDRAAFHFLVDLKDRDAYLDRLSRCVRSGGHAIIATFALDGPETCSGLPVVRYSPESLAETLGNKFTLLTERPCLHQIPSGKQQSFQFSLFRKVG